MRWTSLLLVFTLPALAGMNESEQKECVELRRTPQRELDGMYAAGRVGKIPVGETRGCVVGLPDFALNEATADFMNFFWRGKVFDPNGHDVVNHLWNGYDVKAEVFVADSWLDGRNAIIIDYRHTSLWFWTIRDEIREIRPGLYLGRMYKRGGGLTLNFALFQ